jgi:hypothetical protein
MIAVTSIEQQLIGALAETPHETDCSISAALLSGLGLKDGKLQANWLNTHRPAHEGKSWHQIENRWVYTVQQAAVETVKPPFTRPPFSWRTEAIAERFTAPIKVKPVVPLRRTT